MELTEAPKGMALTPVPAALPAEQTEPRSLVQLAIERNVPVEILKQLVALQQQVAERDARAAFVEALTAFRAECPPIPKTHENTQFSVTRNGVKRTARYASLEDIDRIARPVAASHGFQSMPDAVFCRSAIVSLL